MKSKQLTLDSSIALNLKLTPMGSQNHHVKLNKTADVFTITAP